MTVGRVILFLFLAVALVNCCDLSQQPCVETLTECQYPLIPNPGRLFFTPYPICLPKGDCADDPALRGFDGLLHTFQEMNFFVSDTSQFQYKRLHARSTLRVGKKQFQASGSASAFPSKRFPKCITNKFFDRDATTTEFAYGTCDLDTAPMEEDDGNLCELFNALTTSDETGQQNVLRCTGGLVHFSPESSCSVNPQCSITVSFDSKYREDGPAIYRPFRDATIRVDVELFQTAAYEGDQSNLVQVENQHCRQYLSFDKCVGFFTLHMNTEA